MKMGGVFQVHELSEEGQYIQTQYLPIPSLYFFFFFWKEGREPFVCKLDITDISVGGHHSNIQLLFSDYDILSQRFRVKKNKQTNL